ncbi:MAG: protein kinase [Pyrinomonadaceae bacterium]
MKPLAPNTTLQNRYQLTRLIGKGGMGEVYLAVDTRLGHSVALKRTTVGDDAVLGEAFEQEARTLASLRHPVLPKVSDHFIENGEQFLVMDYIEGEDLSKRLRSTKKPFPLNWVLFWADQLLEALEYLHKHRPPIIHRDIKPQNLKLTPENQIILLDFGLSKRSIGETKVTSSGSVVGYTPHYAPMEQIRGTGTNARSDIYSLSATLYQLLTAVVPADSLTRADSMIGGDPDPLRPLTEHNSEISQELSDIILKGMMISQEKRYASARDMQKELRKAFNALQASMSAETVAFNVGDDGFPDADNKTEVGSNLDAVGIIDRTASDVPAFVPIADDGDFSGDKTEVINMAEISGGSDSGSVSEEPFGIKTEEFTGTGLPATSPDSQYRSNEEFGETAEVPAYSDEGYTGTGFDDEEESSFTPDATVPLISIDDPSAGTGSVDDAEDYGDAASDTPVSDATMANAGGFEDQEDGREDAPAGGPPPQKKSSAGKYIAILGGLGVILLLLLGTAVAIGWYITNQGVETPDENTNVSTPTPEPTAEETPEEEPTPANSNEDVFGDNTNSNAEDSTNSNGDNTDSTDPGNTTDTGKTNPTPRPTRTQNTVKTPKPNATAKPTTPRTPRPAPTKKPTRDPGILQ